MLLNRNIHDFVLYHVVCNSAQVQGKLNKLIGNNGSIMHNFAKHNNYNN